MMPIMCSGLRSFSASCFAPSRDSKNLSHRQKSPTPCPLPTCRRIVTLTFCLVRILRSNARLKLVLNIFNFVDDRTRVKLRSVFGVPNSDYINASFVTVRLQVNFINSRGCSLKKNLVQPQKKFEKNPKNPRIFLRI